MTMSLGILVSYSDVYSLQSGGITPSQLAAALASATQGGATNQVGQNI